MGEQTTTQTITFVDKPPLPYITPYYPKEAADMARRWETSMRQPVFAIAIQREYESDCKNCGGTGVIYLRLAERGPFSVPMTTKQVSTYFDGDGQYRKGWYVIKETMGFSCPHCKGKAV